MADSAFTKFKDDVAKNPATERLRDELQDYLSARARHAVTNLGHKLGESAGKLADGSAPTGAVKSLAKGGKALGEGKSPAQAALSAGGSHVMDTIKDKVKGVFGKGRKGGGGKSKSVTISEDIDVGVPVREAYDQWTQFQEFSTFAKGVVSVEKSDDTSSNWKVKVAKSTRSWKANVTEQVPDERITWTTEGAKGTVKGVVTFHRITDNLTRVLLVLEYFPKGLFEKTGNIWRAQGRRARLDLKLYRKFIMMRGEATDSWRGEIRDGEVVVDHDEAARREEESEENDGEDTSSEDTSEEEAEFEDGEPEEGEPEDRADEPDERDEPDEEFDDEPEDEFDEDDAEAEESDEDVEPEDGEDEPAEEADEEEADPADGDAEWDEEEPEEEPRRRSPARG
ncbi:MULTISPECIES: SRPBCC family protein [unclassified Streptomyces]|uniref:SRPBCC family protein n=1 Tax=unclassified Streptomyces TaxID=2593676 RepID=UPI001C2EBFAE|nr:MULTISPECIES: SRPBCC family protein [unclassified Streptomyces]MBV1956601.1 SRPBCC family protein [Streptomyces sp. BV333]MCQ9706997.1 SRPBCC family protein [Streptomyces sp. BSP1]